MGSRAGIRIACLSIFCGVREPANLVRLVIFTGGMDRRKWALNCRVRAE